MTGKLKQEELQEQAAAYALGTMCYHDLRAFEERLADDPAIAAEVRAFENVVASLALAAPEDTPTPEAKDKLLTRLFGEQTTATPKTASESPAMTAAFSGIGDVRADEGTWEKFSEGIYMKMLFEDKANERLTFLLKMEPGAEIVRHRHRGVEECLVLQGDFNIGDQSYKPGDYQFALTDSIHDRVYSKDGALVLIISPPAFDPVM